MKSKGVAYLLWFFLGIFGAHKFYVGKIGMGIVYLLTMGLFGIGWIIDLFTLGNQVDMYNALHGGRGQMQSQHQTVIVNVPGNSAPQSSVPTPTAKPNIEKAIMKLAQENPLLTFKEIVNKTEFEFDEIESAMKKLVARGIAKELPSPDGNGSTIYDFKD
jgi:hypothetical protein